MADLSLYCLRVTCSLLELDAITSFAHTLGGILMGTGNIDVSKPKHVLNLVIFCGFVSCDGISC